MEIPEYELVVVLPRDLEDEVRVVLRRLPRNIIGEPEEVALVRLNAELWDRLFPSLPAHKLLEGELRPL